MSQPPQNPPGDPSQNWQGQPQQNWQGHPQQGWQGQPPPPPKKRGGCLKSVLIVLGVLIVLIVIIVAVSSGGDDSPTVSSGESNSQEPGSGAAASSGEPVGGGVEFKGKTSKDTAAAAGQTITQKKVSITTTPLQVRESEYTSPQLCTTITIKNGGDEQESFNLFDWKMQDPNGASKSGTPPFDDTAPGFSSGEIAPGGQTSGDLCFDGNPSAAPGEYVVLYQGNVFLSSRLAWVNKL